uniref:RNA binding motif protein 19 n=1 Tax=Scleropages formosus TaxID=113540 RepID=A0A8C9W8N0_SCLFO
MSRLIVKNLPSGMKEERLRAMFSAFGTLTDCVLKFTKEGKFRRFAFVGFREEEDAERATRHFHRSFVDTSRISVERCKSFGDPTKPRAWSRRSHRSATPTEEEEEPQEKKEKEKKKKRKEEEEESSLEQDENFQEFLAVHQNRAHIPTWANDTPTRAANPQPAPHERQEDKVKHKGAKDDYLNFDSDESDEDLEQEEDQEDEDECPTKEALESSLSDMDYLRSKVVSVKGSSVDAEGQDSDEDAKEELLAQLQAGGASESEDKDSAQRAKVEPTTDFTVKLRGAPFNVTEQQVREFMTPLKPVAIRIVRNAYGNKTGYVFVDLRSAEEVEKALRKDKDYMGGRYIEVFQASGDGGSSKRAPCTEEKGGQNRSFQRQIREDEEEEEVSESGRLFVRNLPYTCNERELSDIFAQYGPLAEVHFPIDGLTKKPKGFAFVTYMIPEHAVRALAELDGHVFQGRMLHILPSTLKKEKAEQDPSGPGSSSFKKQRDAKQKAGSTSSHNWNTLFLGTNAVADAIAEKYSTTKSQVLDHESQGSLAVRMALGETQIVQETRQFLLDNHICLDSFSQAAGPRSNAVLLVKNLPAGVKVSELEAVFSPHGSLGRVLLPPSGLTAIVEFLEFSEAKRAFTRLAYTKVSGTAPVPCITLSIPRVEAQEQRADAAASGDEEEEEEESVPGCTLFVKNLNFSTSEETLAEVASPALLQLCFCRTSWMCRAWCSDPPPCAIISGLLQVRCSEDLHRFQEEAEKRYGHIVVVRVCSKCVLGLLPETGDGVYLLLPGDLLSMGYGFVRYKTPKAAQKALRQLQTHAVNVVYLCMTVPRVTTKMKNETQIKKKRKNVIFKVISKCTTPNKEALDSSQMHCSGTELFHWLE